MTASLAEHPDVVRFVNGLPLAPGGATTVTQWSGKHGTAIYAECELKEAPTCKPYLQVGPGIFTRMPFFTAAVKMLGPVNTGTGRRPLRDHQVASSIPAATEDRVFDAIETLTSQWGRLVESAASAQLDHRRAVAIGGRTMSSKSVHRSFRYRMARCSSSGSSRSTGSMPSARSGPAVSATRMHSS